jgi:hypothetical protein
LAEIIQYRGHDCWRTWFFEECEASGLFGINEKHLGLVSLTGKGVHPYRPGTEVYLEDAPVFPASSERFHRVCGPYKVTSAEPLPAGAVVVYQVADVPIVYREVHPELGPWSNRTKRRSAVCGLDLKHPQMAKQFNFYPYRFCIRRSPRWTEKVVSHSRSCPLGDA